MAVVTLIEFLTARLDEDEAVAKAAGFGPTAEWEYGVTEWFSARVQTVETFGSPGYMEHLPITWDREGLSDSVGLTAGHHIARHDPARVLREVEAKRLLIELAVRTQEALDEEWGRTPSTPPELRILAAVYADHPDYDEEWKP